MREWNPKIEASESIAILGSLDSRLSNTDVKGAMAKPLAKSLELIGSWGDDLDLSPLSVCKDAERLAIRYAVNFRLSSFPTMKRVKEVSISHLSGDIVIDECSSFPNLKTFGVYKSPDVCSVRLDGLASHESVEFVTIKDTGIKSLDLSPLSSLKQLSGLTVESTSIEEIDLTPLKECETFHRIYLRFNHSFREIDLSCLPMGIRDVTVTDSDFKTLDLSPLKDFHSLMFIHISKNNLREIDLSPLSQHRYLLSVNLSGNPVGTIDLVPLRTCPSVGTLDLSGMQLNTIDLKPLEGSMLDALYLAQNPLEELDLTPLRECKSLMRISLLFCDRLEVLDVTPIIFLDCEVSHHENTKLIADRRFQTDTWDNVKWY